MFVLTVIIVLYGFKRTEELRTESDVEMLMEEPRRATFGGVPVGLLLGAGGPAKPAEGSALFDDGLMVLLSAVEMQPCMTCPGQKEPVAVLHLSGGRIPEGRTVTARLSVNGAPLWGDYDYLFSLLDIGAGFVVFGVEGPQP